MKKSDQELKEEFEKKFGKCLCGSSLLFNGFNKEGWAWICDDDAQERDGDCGWQMKDDGKSFKIEPFDFEEEPKIISLEEFERLMKLRMFQ